MPEMIERVARAIARELGEGGDAVEYYDIARAAIEAMREPTPEMLPAEMYEKTYRHIWQKMISAALREKQ
jgi:hypothetical protein